MQERIPLNVQIKLKRVQLNLLQIDLADKSGVSQSFISRYESGKTVNPGIDNVRRLCVVLEIEESEINFLNK